MSNNKINNTMSNIKKIKIELCHHILDRIDDESLTDENIDDWHHIAFNTDYYIIGYYQCEEWLKKYNISVFDAIDICSSWNNSVGIVDRIYNNAERLVNDFVYILGEEIFNDLNAENLHHLQWLCKKEIKEFALDY